MFVRDISNDVAHGALVQIVFDAQVYLRCAIPVVCSYLLNHRIGMLSVAVLLAARHEFRMTMRPVIIAALPFLGIKPCCVTVASSSIGLDSLAMLRSSRLASLANHIFAVLFIGTIEKMLRSAARWIIAFMAHVQFAGIVARRKIERDAMCPEGFIMDGDAAIAALPSEGFPLPAVAFRTLAGRLVNVAPEHLGPFGGKRLQSGIRFSHEVIVP